MTFDPAMLSLVGQLGSAAGAAAIGRFLLKSRILIWCCCFLGAFGAMCAHIAYDGQGAFMWLIFTPLIYWAATGGRYDI